MNVALWICQSILCLVFVVTGILKLFTPIPQLADTLNWVGDLPASSASGLFVRGLGVLEVLMGLMVMLPRLVSMVPVSATSYAAYGIMVVMVGAMALHIRRDEFTLAIAPLLLFIMASAVVVGTQQIQAGHV